MKTNELISFIEKDMRMSADYQPRVISALIQAPGERMSFQDLANATGIALATLRKMPLAVLKNRGIVVLEDGSARLNLDATPNLKNLVKINKMCQDKIQDFNSRRNSK